MPWNINVVMLFFALGDMLLVLTVFALGDVLLVSTEPLHTAMIQIGKTSVVEGEKFEFKCLKSAVHEEQPENKENWFHLYKNKEKISSLPKPGGMGAVTFIKQDIRKNDTGIYTCMYGNENPGDLTNISHGSSVYLNVQESRYQLTLQLDKHNQMEGMNVSFKCMIPAELRDAIGKEGFFHLYKNGSLVDSQPDPKHLPGVTFSIKNVTRNDTGNYTCIYGKEKLVNSTNSKRSRPVDLHVTDMTTPNTSIKTQQTNETGDMTTPTTSNKTQQTNDIGSVPVLYLGAGVGCGVLVLLLLLIGGVLKCLQSKRDPTVQIEPVYTTVCKPKQPSKQQDDTFTYSEINTARVTKKKPSSAPDEDTVTYAAVKTSTY
ncbi:uncharacterized protein LOC117432696 isoform X2 [Acipenser ruthenus]|uniref:uncharacterized protein LOC117432696 isoform X2 n=1 Tax=Acipenser ruthenus TaxID=7906 RepID=UPI0027424CF6|nr:uncharacterized protein LOC117432696 isoform X2 [Acipenser ruthenus]